MTRFPLCVKPDNSGFAASGAIVTRLVTNKNEGCVGVLVSIEADATLEQLCTFLDRFDRAAILHQIESLYVDSQEDQGDPRLRVSINAEGLAIQDAQAQNWPLPQATLAGDLSAHYAALIEQMYA